MASFPVMFLITLPLPSMLTEGKVLTLTQKDPIISADHNTNIKTGLDKSGCEGEGSIVHALERIFLSSHQDQILFEDQANADHYMLDLATVLTTLRKCCTQNHQAEPVNFSSMASGFQVTRASHQQDYFPFYSLKEFLNLVMCELLSH
ncbi:exocrine gland-secreted peptide 1 [Phodopus roborovskii]|uniref:Gm44501 protein n=1 Tax=Phodopus roborovskii TaxID=109678 RepID=A0AAV0A6M2_PHORO|nr:exocrine gland-secreted peptide 1 [Phodopus roborovskii]CAH7221415.1 Gm44501 [Phodopus roborovskii]